MAFCTDEAIEIWKEHCKDKSVKVGDNFISHISIHDTLKVIDIALKKGQELTIPHVSNNEVTVCDCDKPNIHINKRTGVEVCFNCYKPIKQTDC